MTCEEALKKLYEVIDKEANDIDVQKVKEHLSQCKSCMSRYEFETMFKTFVVEKASSPAKSESLKKKVLGRIDKIEDEKRGIFGRFRYGAVMAAVAATLIICIVAAFATAKFYRHKTEIYPFEKAHLAAFTNDNPQTIIPASASDDGFFAVADERHVGVNCACPTMKYLDASQIKIGDYELTQVRCTCRDENVSILIGDRNEISLPDFKKVVINNKEYFQHICSECVVLYWYVDDSIIIAVSSKRDLDMSTLVTAVEPI